MTIGPFVASRETYSETLDVTSINMSLSLIKTEKLETSPSIRLFWKTAQNHFVILTGNCVIKSHQ